MHRMSANPHEKLSARELVLIFAFWTFLAVLSSVNRLLDPRGFGFRMMPPTGPIALEVIGTWIWAALTPLIFRLTSRIKLSRVALLIVLGVVVSIAVYSAIDLIRPLLLPPPPRARGRPQDDRAPQRAAAPHDRLARRRRGAAAPGARTARPLH